jgi:hypothetical protein
LSRYGELGSPQRVEYTLLVFLGRRQCLSRLLLLARPARGLDHAPNPTVGALKDVMTSDGLSAARQP